MAQPFDRTLRSLEHDGNRRYLIALLLAVLLLGAWTGWFLFARLSIYAVSAEARIEVESAAHAVDAPTSARLTAVHVSLGQQVAAGETLFELEVESLGEQLIELRHQFQALDDSEAALGNEIDGIAGQRRLAARTKEAALAEAEARHREAEAAARQADTELGRFTTLHGEGLMSAAEVDRAKSESEQRWAAAEALERGGERQIAEHASRDRELAAGRDPLRRELAGIHEQRAVARAAVASLAHQIDLRTLRSPVAGRVGQLAEINPGSVVAAGQRLATVVPDGRPRAVAFFPAAEASGRIRPGQRARVRLTGFPALQYGSLEATVTRVGSEIGDAAVRVELELADDPPAAIPVEHGLPGSVEVEIGRASPAALLLYTAGRAVDRRWAGGDGA
ncbi:MAG: HlyD family efflux transporter periplasmic adaptor subunit [Thermoanaerobaculia bacterium]